MANTIKSIPVYLGSWGHALAVETTDAGSNQPDGQIIWEWKPGSIKGAGTPDGWSTIHYHSGMLFVSISRFTYRLDPATGAELWEKPFTMPGDGGLRTLPRLATMDGRLFVGYKGRVAALDPKTGVQIPSVRIYNAPSSDQMEMLTTCSDPTSDHKGGRLIVTAGNYGLGLDGKLHELWKDSNFGPAARFQTLATGCPLGATPGGGGLEGPPVAVSDD